MGVVYLITNLVTGRYYIGQSIRLRDRLWQHRSLRSSQTPIGHAIRKYGWHNFAVEVLGEANRGADLDALEQLWIAVSNSVDRTAGYNLRPGGQTSSFTAETREKMAAAKRGRKLSDEQKAKLSAANIGRKRPDVSERMRRPEVRANVSTKLRGKPRAPLSPESIQKMIETKKRKALPGYWRGKKRPDTAARNSDDTFKKLCWEGRDKMLRERRENAISPA